MRRALYIGMGLLLILWVGCAKKGEEVTPKEEMKIVGTISLVGAPSSEGVEVKVEALGISTTTDAKGAFTLTGVMEGVWEISIYKSGYTPKKIEVKVEAGQTTTNIGKIELEPAGIVSGIITLEGATNFKGVSVKLKAESGEEISSATTDDKGFFELVDLPPGDYTLTAEMDGYEEIREPVTVESGKKTELTLSMKPLAGLGPEKGLIAYWSFDEGTGNVVKDYSGNKNDGKVINTKWVKQKKGYALEFDGTSSYVDTPLVQLAETGYTIEAWVKTTADQGMIVQNRGASGAGLSLTLAIGPACNDSGKGNWCPSSSAGVPAIGIDSNNIWVGVNATTPVNDGKWHHIVGVWLGDTNLKIYVDGKDVSGPKATIGSPTPPFRGEETTTIGGKHIWAFFGFSGLIDEVRIYNRALSDKEIADHYNKMKGWFEG